MLLLFCINVVMVCWWCAERSEVRETDSSQVWFLFTRRGRHSWQLTDYWHFLLGSMREQCFFLCFSLMAHRSEVGRFLDLLNVFTPTSPYECLYTEPLFKPPWGPDSELLLHIPMWYFMERCYLSLVWQPEGRQGIRFFFAQFDLRVMFWNRVEICGWIIGPC